MMANLKPIGGMNYGSIPHLPDSRVGPGDHHCHEGQAIICTVKARDKHDTIIVQEKLDGSNVGVAKIDNKIVALGRAGYLASTSPYEQHHKFSDWVRANEHRFSRVLRNGERVVGEWLLQAHGTRYDLFHEPFVAFDIMRKRGMDRFSYIEVSDTLSEEFEMPYLVHIGGPISINDALERLGTYGKHGALDPAEGLVWRVERDGKPDFIAKYVKKDKVDGAYLEHVTGGPPIWNDLLSELS
jgi:ATP-dependent RNA circularization protein (DNA/RNA ligase family)